MVNILPKKTVLSIWETFLALENNTTEDPGERVNLFTTLWLDSVNKNKIQACNILLIFATASSKHWMTIANENNRNSKNLTAMGVNLARRLRFTVVAMVQLVKQENYLDVKLHLIACLHKLVQNVPFSRLEAGLVLPILNYSCKPLFQRLQLPAFQPQSTTSINDRDDENQPNSPALPELKILKSQNKNQTKCGIGNQNAAP